MIKVIFICLVIVLIIAVTLYEKYMSQPLNIYRSSINIKWSSKAFNECGCNKATDDFRRNGKPTHTKKGEYRADFRKAWEKSIQEYRTLIGGREERFSEDFVNYCKAKYGVITRKNITNAIMAYDFYRQEMARRNMNDIVAGITELTPEEFFESKHKTKGDIVGVYVIYNKTKNMYYVGQAKRLFFRVNQHFTGHGNGDVYADYKYGNKFTIKLVVLAKSGYSDIDKLEKDMIDKYDAFNSGYNRTAGNK